MIILVFFIVFMVQHFVLLVRVEALESIVEDLQTNYKDSARPTPDTVG